MTRHRTCVVVAMVCCLLALATSAFAEWTLWQQSTVFAERWWVPKGWSTHWKATETRPVGLSEFATLADCQLAQAQAIIRDSTPSRKTAAAEPDTPETVNRFACVPSGWRPTAIEPGGLWK